MVAVSDLTATVEDIKNTVEPWSVVAPDE